MPCKDLHCGFIPSGLLACGWMTTVRYSLTTAKGRPSMWTDRAEFGLPSKQAMERALLVSLPLEVAINGAGTLGIVSQGPEASKVRLLAECSYFCP
mmetsp:Transcript_25122/g.61948  ORF Transcript_25122/g.61948 Transcript_25122/m.61948 type:complete len:96 (+) Transcript_25122:759-1046(+)